MFMEEYADDCRFGSWEEREGDSGKWVCGKDENGAVLGAAIRSINTGASPSRAVDIVASSP